MKQTIAMLCALALVPLAPRAETVPAHHTADGYRNLYIERPKEKGFFTYMRMRYFSDEVFADHDADAGDMPVAADAVAAMNAPSAQPRVTWLGHSTFLVQYRGINILTDPILSDRASPVFFAGPPRLVAKPVTISDLPRIDYVVISHNHYDHLDQFTIELLGDGPLYLVPLGLREWFEDLRIDGARVLEFDWWDERKVDGVRFIATPSQHWSGRGLHDRYETLWASWRIEFDGFSIWFAGDTGYNDRQFREIHERYGDVDLALIPIGSYAPRWFMQSSHVNPLEAVNVHNDIGAALSIGMHWGTFQLSAEPFFEPRTGLEAAVADGRVERGEFITLAIGETLHYPRAATTAAVGTQD